MHLKSPEWRGGPQPCNLPPPPKFHWELGRWMIFSLRMRSWWGYSSLIYSAGNCPWENSGKVFSFEFGIVTTILFIFQLIISFSSTVNREDLAQGFTEQNGFYQSSSVSPSRATVPMSEALTLDPLEQLRHPLPKSVRGTEGSSVLWDALLRPQERNQRGLRRSTRSAFLYLNPNVNLLMCAFHLDSREPYHHCLCRLRKQPSALPPVYLFIFSVWFWFFAGEQARVTSISSWPFQQYTLPVSNCSALNFLDSTETAGRPAFSSDSLPLLLLPSMMGGALFLRFIHPKFQETWHFLSSSYSKPDRLTFPSCLQIRAFSWLYFTSLSGFVTTVYPFSSLVHSYDYFFYVVNERL